jgi:hypothetical protein
VDARPRLDGELAVRALDEKLARSVAEQVDLPALERLAVE